MELRRLPAAGLIVWLAVFAARAPAGLDEATLAELIVLFIPLCAAPLALPQAVRADMSSRTGPAGLAGAGAALLLAIGVACVDTGGPVAAALAVPWLLFAVAVAIQAGLRLLRRRPWSTGEAVLDVGQLALPGAAVWLLVYRADLVFAGFGGLAAVLTAAHFHAAGFGALVMTGLVGRGLALAGASRARRVHAVVAVLMVIAFAGLAAGIATGVRAIELTGACLYAAGLPTLAGLQIFAALRATSGRARVALVLSSLGLLVATGYALMFAVQGFYGAAVPIATMLRLHGAINAFVFLGLGLWGWSRVDPRG